MERIIKKKKASLFLSLSAIFIFSVSVFFAIIVILLSQFNIYVIHNGEDKNFHISRADVVSEIISEAGIALAEDKYAGEPEKIAIGVKKIQILTKHTVNLTDGTNQAVIYAESGQTVSELLHLNNITIGENDLISPDITAEIVDDIQIVITRISYSTLEETVSIPFKTEKRNSSSMNKGTSKVVQNGVNGTKKIVYSVKNINGKEASRSIVSETVTKQPVAKIVEYGTKVVSTSGVVTTKDGKKLNYKKKLSMTATAYTTERTSDKITATGKVAKVGYVAVDPRVIPLHSKLYIVSADGKSWCYGIAVAEDTGVRGNKIDLFFNTYKECISFGVRKATVYVL